MNPSSRADTIVQRASDYDLVVLGETQPSVREILFGTAPAQITRVTDVPISVVRHEDPEGDVAEMVWHPVVFPARRDCE